MVRITLVDTGEEGREWKDKLPSRHAPGHYPGQKFISPFFCMYWTMDSQSLGARFDAWMEVYLSILFLCHLCQQSNSYRILNVFIHHNLICTLTSS